VQRIATLGLEVPHDFAAGPYEAIHKRLTGGAYVTPVEDTPEDHIWSQYSGAWNALAYLSAPLLCRA
jgi:hypothetical protein